MARAAELPDVRNLILHDGEVVGTIRLNDHPPFRVLVEFAQPDTQAKVMHEGPALFTWATAHGSWRTVDRHAEDPDHFFNDAEIDELRAIDLRAALSARDVRWHDLPDGSTHGLRQALHARQCELVAAAEEEPITSE